MHTVLRFTATGSENHDLVGGKGANLARLANEGFTVPPGFMVTTDGYKHFLTETGLRDRLDRRVNELDFDDAAKLEDQTSEIRALVESMPMPEALGEQILEYYTELGADRYVAVRSSGPAEELPWIVVPLMTR